MNFLKKSNVFQWAYMHGLLKEGRSLVSKQNYCKNVYVSSNSTVTFCHTSARRRTNGYYRYDDQPFSWRLWWEMYRLGKFSTLFSKRDNLCDFLFGNGVCSERKGFVPQQQILSYKNRHLLTREAKQFWQ